MIFLDWLIFHEIFLNVLDQVNATVRNNFYCYPRIHSEKVGVLEKVDEKVDKIVNEIVDERIGESVVEMFVVGDFFHSFWRKCFVRLKYFPMMNHNHHNKYYKVVFED